MIERNNLRKITMSLIAGIGLIAAMRVYGARNQTDPQLVNRISDLERFGWSEDGNSISFIKLCPALDGYCFELHAIRDSGIEETLRVSDKDEFEWRKNPLDVKSMVSSLLD